MTVKFYTYTGENIRADKSSLLGSSTDIQADYGFEGNQNVEAPFLNIKSTTKPTYNYCYIDSFARYYYIVSCTWLSADIWRLGLVVDPVYTGLADVKNQEGVIMYSGLGSAKKYDPRLVYNKPAVRTVKAAVQHTAATNDGGDPWIVLACRFTYTPTGTAPAKHSDNQMSYLCFSKEAYSNFILNLMDLADAERVAISKTIVSATVVHWLNFENNNVDFWTGTAISSGQYQKFAYFNSPELMGGGSAGVSINVQQWPNPTPAATPTTWYPFYQLTADNYVGRRVAYFLDDAGNYPKRKAQRLVDIPFVGQLSIDLDNLAVPLSYDAFYLSVTISYDFGGNEYVVTPGYFKTTEALTARTDCVDCVQTFTNSYSSNFISDDSYQAEAETRAAQMLSVLGTLATGIASGLITQGASVPASVASLGVGLANFNLTDQKLTYQQGASISMKGSSNGGSMYNAMISYYGSTGNLRPKAQLFIRTNEPSTSISSFSAKWGLPDGEYRTILSLVGTGFVQMGSVYLTGCTWATNNEKNEIKNALLSGIII